MESEGTAASFRGDVVPLDLAGSRSFTPALRVLRNEHTVLASGDETNAGGTT